MSEEEAFAQAMLERERAAAKAERDKIIEECAKVADAAYYRHEFQGLPDAIRALKSTLPTSGNDHSNAVGGDAQDKGRLQNAEPQPLTAMIRAAPSQEGVGQEDVAVSAPSVPPVVRVSLMALLNHVEPGWDNCKATVQAWLSGEFPWAKP